MRETFQWLVTGGWRVAEEEGEIPRAKCALGMTARFSGTRKSGSLASLGMTNSRLRSSPFEEIHFVGEDGFAVAEERDDDAETDGGLGGRVSNDEEGEDLP